MSLLTQALRLGLALASISALGRRRRMVMVFDVTQGLYHTSPGWASRFSPLQQLAHHRLLFLQLSNGEVDLGAAEVVDRQALHDFQLVPAAVNGEGASEARRVGL